MSRRKQGRPQQRKTLDELDTDHDLLTCGACQTEYPLSDIVHFIQHKAEQCSQKDTTTTCNDDANDDDSDKQDDEPLISISSRRTSISAPIARKENLSEVWEIISPQLKKCIPESNNGDLAKMDLAKPDCVDAEVNTYHSEPQYFKCHTCQQEKYTAWDIVQHAQQTHGIQIYIEDQHEKTNTRVSSSRHSSTEELDTVKKEDESFDENREQQMREEEIKRKLERDMPEGLERKKLRLDSTGDAQRENDERQEQEQGHPAKIMKGMQPPNPFMPFPIGPTVSPIMPHPYNRPGGMPDFHHMDIGSDPYVNRHLLHGMPLPPGIEHHPAFPNIFDRSRGLPGMINIDPSLMDFYSKRLRQLAGATSPTTSPVRKQPQTPPYSKPPTPSAFSTASTSGTTPSSPTQSNSEGKLPPPLIATNAMVKLKACEFCGKTFRFQSNLIVHRRSHTGEKPFKCPLCPHACTQASKLKRHMKTHRNDNRVPGHLQSSMGQMSDNSLHSSNSGSPDGSNYKYGINDDFDSDDEEEEEEEEEEMEGEEFEEMEKEMQATDLTASPSQFWNGMALPTNPVKPDEPTNDEHPNDPKVKEECEDEPTMSKDQDRHSKGQTEDAADLTVKEKASVLNQIMECSGLSRIQQYSEAFQQALVDTTRNPTPRSSIEEQQKMKKSPEPAQNGFKHQMPLENGFPHEPPPFRSKLDKARISFERVEREQKMEREQHQEREQLRAEQIKMEQTLPMEREEKAMAERKGTKAIMEKIPPEVRRELPPMEPAFIRSLVTDVSREQAYGLKEFRNGTRIGDSPGVYDMIHHNNAIFGPASVFHHRLPTPTLLRPEFKERRRNDTCEFCGKVFKNCSNLTVHRRSHTGEKPYKCNMCSYACAQSSKLTRHMKTHGRQGKDVYRCKFCQMPFSVAATLEKHMRKCVGREISPQTLGLHRQDSTHSNNGYPMPSKI